MGKVNSAEAVKREKELRNKISPLGGEMDMWDGSLQVQLKSVPQPCRLLSIQEAKEQLEREKKTLEENLKNLQELQKMEQAVGEEYKIIKSLYGLDL
jgi:hypothetical protein